MKLLLIENPTNQIINIIQKTIKNNQRSLIAAEAILQADPTPRKKYIKWLANLLNKGHVKVSKAFTPPDPQIILPEDNPRVHKVINTFEKAKPRLPHDQRNILGFKDFYTLENLLDKLVSTAQVRTGGMVKNIPGAEVIYNEEPYTVYQISRVGKSNHTNDEKERIMAIEILGMGPPETKWCTRRSWGRNSLAPYYLARNNMYVIYKDGVPFAQKCGTELKDVNDRKIDLLPRQLDFIDKIEMEANKKRLASLIEKYKNTPNIIMTTNSVEPHKYIKLIDFGDFSYVIKGPSKVSERTYRQKLTPLVKRHQDLGILKIDNYFIHCNECGSKNLKAHGERFAELPAEMHPDRLHNHRLYCEVKMRAEYFTVNNRNIILQT